MRTGLMLVAAMAVLFAVTVVWAAEKTYQVTGPVTELTDSMLVVDKKGEMHQIARTADTKVKGDLKVGEKAEVRFNNPGTYHLEAGAIDPIKTTSPDSLVYVGLPDKVTFTVR